MPKPALTLGVFLLLLGGITQGVEQPEGVYYSSYLEIPQLLSLNKPLTANQDESLFITVHQMIELGFKQMLMDFASMENYLSIYMSDGNVQHLKSTSRLAKRAVQILQLLSSSLNTLKSTLEPSSFAEFRLAFGNASGYQSWQFRQIEAQLGLKISERALQSLDHTDRLKVEMFIAKPNFNSMLQRIFEDHHGFGDFDVGISDIGKLAPLLGNEWLGKERCPSHGFFSHRALAAALWAYMNKADPRFAPFAEAIEAFSGIASATHGFRAAHIALARYQIAEQPGTGGSTGVAYLEHQLASQLAFPDFQIIVSRSDLLPVSLLAKKSAPDTPNRGDSTDLILTGLVDHIERMAIRFPTQVAVVEDSDVSNGRSIDYSTLCLHARHLAQRLRKAIFVTGSSGRVGVYCRKSIELVVAELAALMAGVCFIPLGVSWPESRISKIIIDADIRVVVADVQNSDSLLLVNGLSQPVELVLPMLNAQGALHFQIQASPSNSNDTFMNSAPPSEEAYMIYTSGTTGDPKGVVLSRKAANIAIYSLIKLVPLAPWQRYVTILTAQPIFDFSIAQMFCPLALGGTIVIPIENAEADGMYIAGLFTKYNISVQALLPSMARALLDSDLDLGGQLAHLVVAGEEFPIALARDIFDVFKRHGQHNISIHNGYGPTENGIGACAFTMTSMQDVLELGSGRIPITDANGVFPYREFDVIDPKSGKLIRHGTGELVISGESLADGYHGKAAQTKHSFRPNPHRDGQRSYWTGDLVEIDTHRMIYFLGRKDNQVKLSGFRIELHEVEHAARSHGKVLDVVALVSGHLLLLYIVAKIDLEYSADLVNAQAIMRSEVRMICVQMLPDYAVPSAIIFVDSFPTNANGKIDKKRLRSPIRRDFGLEVPEFACETFVPDDTCSRGRCRSELLQLFLNITSESVGFQVYPCDSWIYLGINSRNTQEVLRKAKQRGISVSLADLHASDHLSHLPISWVEGLITNSFEQEACEGKRLYPALPMQRAMLDATMKGGRSRQIVQLVLQLEETPINRPRLKQAAQKVVETHDGLRTVFRLVQGNWYQEILPASVLRPCQEWVELDGESQVDIDSFLVSDKSQGFQLENLSCPLLRFAVGNAHLVISVHHALLDGISADLMLQQIIHSYMNVDFSDSTAASSVAEYLCQASTLKFATPEPIEESPNGYIEKHYSLSLHGLRDDARKNKVTLATQLLWLCHLSLPNRSIGIIVSGRDLMMSKDDYGIVGMLIGYNKLPGNIQNVKEMQQEVMQLRMAPHTSNIGGFDVLINIRDVASGPGYQLVRVEETLGYPFVLEFFTSQHSCRIHLQFTAEEASAADKVMLELMPKGSGVQALGM